MSLDKGLSRRERLRLREAGRSRLSGLTAPGVSAPEVRPVSLTVPVPNELAGLPVVLADIAFERARQVRLWGAQDHAPAMWLAILTEECGEVAKEVADGRVQAFNNAQYRTELIHVAAVAAAAIESLDRVVA